MPKKAAEKKPEFCPLQVDGCSKVKQVDHNMTEARKELKEQGERIIKMDTKIDGITGDLSTIKTHLVGNGREGICDRVTRVEGKCKFTMWFSLLIIGAIVTALIIIGVNHFANVT